MTDRQADRRIRYTYLQVTSSKFVFCDDFVWTYSIVPISEILVDPVNGFILDLIQCSHYFIGPDKKSHYFRSINRIYIEFC